MTHNHCWMIAMLTVACLQSGGCRQASSPVVEDKQEEKPATVVHLEGDQPTRVTLTEEAAKRLDIQTTAIRNVEMDGAQHRVMPYAAILYDTEGNTWTYTNPEPLIFFRNHITVDRIDGDNVVLSDGPDVDAMVVTVGAAELYGSEIEFEEE